VLRPRQTRSPASAEQELRSLTPCKVRIEWLFLEWRLVVVYLAQLESLFDPDPVEAAVARCVARVFAPRAQRQAAARQALALSSKRPGAVRLTRAPRDRAVAGRVARVFRRRPRRPLEVGDLGSRRLGIVRG